MESKGEQLLQSDRATIWSMLNDAEVLRQCIPGCESIVATGEHSYDITMSAAVGPVKARFKGKLSLADIEPPVRYRLLFEGQSSQAGFARGEARVELQELAPNQTKLVYTAQSQIGGKLAQIGSRLIDAGAAATAQKFFEAFARQLPERPPPAEFGPGTGPGAVATPSPPGLWRWLSSFLRHLFARKV
jgi:carbon monoxide dehydrogenase subunit G